MKARLLKYAVSAALLGVALWWLDWTALKRCITLLSAGLLAAVFGLNILLFCVTALRWLIMIQPLARRTISEHLRIYFYANLLNIITPGNLGGDAYRILNLKADAGTVAVVVTVVQERILGLLGYLGIFLGAYLLAESEGHWTARHALLGWVALGSAAAIAGACGAVCATGRLERHLGDLENRFPRLGLVIRAAVRGEGRVFIPALLLSLLSTAIWVSIFWLIARDLGLGLSWAVLGLLSVLVELVRLVPVTVQGIGVRENAAAFFAVSFGSTYEAGFLLATVCYLVNNVAMLVLGGAGALLNRGKTRTAQ